MGQEPRGMDGVAPPHFRVGVLGIARDIGSRVLLVRVTYGNRGWQLPGGFLEATESPEAALRREFREELGADIRVVKLRGVYYKAFEKNLALIFDCIIDSPKLTLSSDEIEDFRYFSVEDLPDGVSSRTAAVVRTASAHPDQPFVLTFERP